MAEAEVPAVVPAEVAVVKPVGLRRRRRLEVSRERLTVRLSAGELAEIGVAARRAGLTRSGFVASAAVRAARGVVPVAGEEALPAVVGEATRALDWSVTNFSDRSLLGLVLVTCIVRLLG